MPKPNETINHWSGFVRMESVNLQKLLFGEAILVSITYCAARWLIVAGYLDTQSNSNLHTSYIKVPIYIILQTIACIAWIAFGLSTTSDEKVVNATSPSPPCPPPPIFYKMTPSQSSQCQSTCPNSMTTKCI